MKYSQTLLLALAAGASAAQAGLFSRDVPAWHDWDNSQLERWLTDHKVPNPGQLSTEQLRDLVQANYDKAYDAWTEADIRAWMASNSLVPTPTPNTRDRAIRAIKRSYDTAYHNWEDSDLHDWLVEHGLAPKPKSTRDELVDQVRGAWGTANSYVGAQATNAQAAFAKQTARPPSSAIVDAWTDSELREFLLKNGIVAPSSKAEELRILAKQQLEKTPGYASQASASASSLGAQATAALGEAYYASADAPRLAYDYLSNAFDETKDYVYSSWSDSDLRSYLESKGVVKTPVEAKRDDLVSQVKGLYNDAADNVYDTWSDTYLRKWLVNHGVLQTRSAKTRDDLLHLAQKNYYSARDTTYNSWSDSQLRNWAISRGLIDSKATKSRKELTSILEDNYYSARDTVYQTWDDNTIRNWLEKKGFVKTPAQAKRDDLLSTMKSYFYTANDRLWDTWSDAEARTYLVKNKIVNQADAAGLKRDKLRNCSRTTTTNPRIPWKRPGRTRT